MTLRRGFMLAPYAPRETVAEAFSWKANILRYPILATGDTENNLIRTKDGYLQFVQLHVQHIKANVIPESYNKGIIAVDLHTPPNAYDTIDHSEVDTIRKAWRIISNEFRGHDRVKILDLLNEPRDSGEALMRRMEIWRSEVRAADREIRIAISSQKGEPQRFNDMRNFTDSRVWYTAHMYSPMSFTHQGIGGRPTGVRYPTLLNNKKSLKSTLKRLRDFQLKTRDPIFIGEFSASNLADGMDRRQYITDLISIFEEYRWHWCFHAFRENPVWTPFEWVDVPLKEAFAKNTVF